jgi:hypothetical protein
MGISCFAMNWLQSSDKNTRKVLAGTYINGEKGMGLT